MSKLLGSLGLCLMLGSVQQLAAQDPFMIPRYEPEGGEETASFFQGAPAGQTEPTGPIIQTLPATKAKPMYNHAPLNSRTQNAQVRKVRTPAQNYIYQRAVFQAKQRNRRIELRKWRGESLLRPSNRPDHSWFLGHHVPVYYPVY